MKKQIQEFQIKWNRFWFESYSPVQLHLLRTATAVLLFGFYAIRALDLQWLYSETGLLTYETLSEAFPFQYRWTLLQWFRSDLSVYVLHTVFLLSLLGMLWGRFARVFTVIAFILHLSFLQRNVAVIFGADNIATHLLFCLCFVPSRDSAQNQKLDLNHWHSIFGSIAFRFVQVQMCIVYIYSGLEKLKGPTWWKGEAIWYVLANPQFARVNLDWAANLPIVLSIATYLTLLWEIYFTVLVWLPSWRKKVLLFGVLFHLGIGFMVNIPYFSLLMIASYSVFLTQEEVIAIPHRIKSLKTLIFKTS